MALSPFEKRVKRRVGARQHQFFAVCPPGLTRFCRNEILEQGISQDDLTVKSGGVLFNAKITDCMRLNLMLGSPVRILMRIHRFKADTFSRFEKNFSAVDWELYLPKNCRPVFKVSLKKSALYHSDAIAQRSNAIILEKLNILPEGTEQKAAEQKIYIRAEKDRFTISLDSSGELLFKRGIKKKVTQAPIRENLAFAMLHWAKLSAGDILVDPMCGSGTFSLEAALIKSGCPPGFFRSFAFEKWPATSAKSFSWLKKNRTFHETGEPPCIFASDIDEKCIDVLKENIRHFPFAPSIRASTKNLFSIDPKIDFKNRKGLVILNPPYGRRLEQQHNNLSLFREIGKKLSLDFKGFKIGIVLPSRNHFSQIGLSLSVTPFFHGGMDVFFGTGNI